MCRDLFWLPPLLKMWNEKKTPPSCTLVWYNRSTLFQILFARVNFLYITKLHQSRGNNTLRHSISILFEGAFIQALWEEARLSVRSMLFSTLVYLYIWARTQATVYITLHCIFSGDFIGSICISFYRSLGVFCYFTVPAFYGFQRRTKCCMCVNSSQVVYNNVQGDAILRKLLCGFDDNGLMWGVWWKLFLGWNVFERFVCLYI